MCRPAFVTKSRGADGWCRAAANSLDVRTGLALATVLAVAGCTVGPDYRAPDAPVNESWQQLSGDAVAAEERWWGLFNDPALTALIESAYRQNLSLRIAGLRVIEARAARGIAVGRFFPQMQQAFGSLGATRVSANDVSGDGDRSFATDAIGLEAAWELDFWGKFRRGIEAADAQLLAAVADYDAVMVSLAADVATSYILIRSLEERLTYARDNVRLQDETLQLTQTRFRAGAVSELDVSTARATLANTRALIPDLEDSLRQSRLSLCVLLGRTPSSLDAELNPPDGVQTRVPEAPPRIAAGIPADLLRRRPDVRAAERLAAAQSARIGEATADLYPSISLTGSTGFASSTFEGARSRDLGDIADSNSFTGFIGLNINWPILNYGRIESNIRVQDARFEQAAAAYQDSVVRAAADVESGLSAFLKSTERADHLREAVAASSRSVELSLIQYRAGAVDFIRVNNAQSELVEQQDSLVVSRASIALGAVRAYRALGGGWEIRGQDEFIDPGTIERMRQRTDWGDVLSPGWQEGKDLGFQRPRPVEPDGGEQK